MKKVKKHGLDTLIEQAYYRHGQEVQISILDIPRLFEECRAALERGEDLDTVMKAQIAKYRMN